MAMKNFHDYYFSLTNEQRDVLVSEVGTSIGYAERVACGYRLPSVPMIMRFIKASKGKVNFKSFVDTFEAKSGPIV